MNATTEEATIAPTPNATAMTAGTVPSALPTTLSTPARRPSAIARPMTNNTLGPGITMITNDVSMNATRFSIGIMNER